MTLIVIIRRELEDFRGLSLSIRLQSKRPEIQVRSTAENIGARYQRDISTLPWHLCINSWAMFPLVNWIDENEEAGEWKNWL